MIDEPGSQDISAVAADPDAFEAFYREYLPVVRLYLARRLDDPAVVADLTADIFLRLIETAGRYRSDLGTPRAWLVGISRNVLADHRRSRARDGVAVRRLAGRRLLDEDSIQRIVDRVAAESQTRALLDSFAGLPKGMRSVVELVAIEGLSFAEAGSVLGIRPGTARVRYHRARKRLQTQLIPEPHEVTP